MSKSKEVFLNFLKWREEFRVDMLPKVNNTELQDILIFIFLNMKPNLHI